MQISVQFLVGTLWRICLERRKKGYIITSKNQNANKIPNVLLKNPESNVEKKINKIMWQIKQESNHDGIVYLYSNMQTIQGTEEHTFLNQHTKPSYMALITHTWLWHGNWHFIKISHSTFNFTHCELWSQILVCICKCIWSSHKRIWDRMQQTNHFFIFTFRELHLQWQGMLCLRGYLMFRLFLVCPRATYKL